jgi:hypothetical protein
MWFQMFSNVYILYEAQKPEHTDSQQVNVNHSGIEHFNIFISLYECDMWPVTAREENKLNKIV